MNAQEWDEAIPYEEKVQYWKLDALRNGATTDDLPESIRSLEKQVKGVYGENMKPILEGWKLALKYLQSIC